MASATFYPASYDDSDPRAPARRAAILMYLLGVLGFLGGICVAVLGILLRDIVTQPQFAVAIRSFTGSIVQLQLRIIIIGATCCIGGLSLIVVGLFVRRGTPAPIISAITLTLFGLLVTSLILVSGLLATNSQNDVTIASLLWMLSVPVLLLMIQLIWLAAALRNVPYLRSIENEINHR